MTAASTVEDTTLADIESARARIAGGVVRTPCVHSPSLSRITGCEVFVKLEYQQRTGSFKERGARNALLQLSDDARRRGVTAASAGNHALALAWHGRDLGIPVTVVMPRVAPLVKQARCRELGARVLIHGANIAEAKDLADKLVADEGLAYVHGFNDAAIIAGAGTVALEVLEEVPDLDAVVVPVGGGGLIAGVGIAMKALRPAAKVIGVEPVRAASFDEALRVGAPKRIVMDPTLADGLAVPEVGARAFALARSRVDSIVTVGEELISLAILRLVEMQHGVVEGAGASPLAALLSGQLPELAGKTSIRWCWPASLNTHSRTTDVSCSFPRRSAIDLAALLNSHRPSLQQVRVSKTFVMNAFSADQMYRACESRALLRRATPSMLMNCSRRCAHVASRSMSGFARSRRANDANCCDSRIQRRQRHRTLPSCSLG